MHKLAVLTFYNKRYRPIGDVTSSVMLQYCQKYGFDFILSMDESLYEGRTPLWAKIPLILKNLDSYDWLLWIDSDAMPVNFNHNALDFIDDNYDIILAEEHHLDGSAINTGVMWVKNSESARKILKESWKKEEWINHCWAEQKGMIEFLNENPDYDRLVEKIDIKPINVKPENFRSSDFIMHIAGGPKNIEYKKEIVESFKKQLTGI